MPLNKDALIRYRVINGLLVNRKLVTKKEMIRACEEALDISPISERTIAQDIQDMRQDPGLGYFAPIKNDRSRGGYYYEDPNFSIDKVPINSDELRALSFAAGILDQFKNIEIFEMVTGAIQKINDVINVNRLQRNRPVSNFIEFEKAPTFKGSEFLKPLIDAIYNKVVLKLHYQRFDSKKAHIHTLHPYYLKESRNRWYLIAFHHDVKEIRTFCLDRIIKVEEYHKLPYEVHSFDAKEYFQNAVGIIAPTEEKPSRILLRFSRLQGNYITSMPIHESQEIVEESEDYITIELNVQITFELIMMILGWGSDVKVLAPKNLVNKVKERIANSLLQYS